MPQQILCPKDAIIYTRKLITQNLSHYVVIYLTHDKKIIYSKTFLLKPHTLSLKYVFGFSSNAQIAHIIIIRYAIHTQVQCEDTDIVCATKISDACTFLGVKLLDYLCATESGYISFHESKFI